MIDYIINLQSFKNSTMSTIIVDISTISTMLRVLKYRRRTRGFFLGKWGRVIIIYEFLTSQPYFVVVFRKRLQFIIFFKWIPKSYKVYLYEFLIVCQAILFAFQQNQICKYTPFLVIILSFASSINPNEPLACASGEPLGKKGPEKFEKSLNLVNLHVPKYINKLSYYYNLDPTSNLPPPLPNEKFLDPRICWIMYVCQKDEKCFTTNYCFKQSCKIEMNLLSKIDELIYCSTFNSTHV